MEISFWSISVHKGCGQAIYVFSRQNYNNSVCHALDKHVKIRVYFKVVKVEDLNAIVWRLTR
uniref:Uncharacterized protein n=1 Tax=Aegilops tauschii TaxID=37682 RepID=M8CJL4_AEGTA